MPDLQNWRLEREQCERIARGICLLTLDVPGRSHNVLSSAVIAELGAALDEVESTAPGALFIRSGKAHGFIAGADVGEFSAIENAQQAAEHVAAAHRVFDRLQALTLPTVALINGHCLGGGLELALACDYRVACDAPAVRLGLPEVRLGIHPGFGGVARLIETVGVLPAMQAMVSGRAMHPAAARRLGLVDFAVPLRQLERTARYVIEREVAPRRRCIPLRQKILSRALLPAPMRKAVAMVLRKKLAARVNPRHYPAPYRLIELWRQHGGSRADLMQAERESVAQLITTPSARNLSRVFFLREGLKQSGGHGGGETFEHVHIIGAGVMGGDIAAWCALCGLSVTLQDANLEAIAAATRRAAGLFQRKLKSRRLARLALDRLRADPAGHGARRADVVIEAIVEDADAKIAVFAELQKTARPDALLATNTSSIPLETLGAALSPDESWPGAASHAAAAGGESFIAPNRLVGLHFFNPVAKMQLVEIVSANETRADAACRAAAFARRIGRLPVAVKSGPGFLVNRILTPYLLEAVELLGEGVPPTHIDRAATDFGMLMGPVELADTVGLDICLRVAQNLVGGNNHGGVPHLLRRRLEQGRLGKKSGRGFYRWVDGKAQKEPSHAHAGGEAALQDRLILRCLNEAVACLHEGVVDGPDSLDAALIFGAGFAPFRGGPLHYIAEQGTTLLDKITALEAQYGARFKPAAGWADAVERER